MRLKLRLKDELIELRHQIHQDAEGGLKEFHTKIKLLGFIQKYLPSNGALYIKEVGDTGVIVTLKGLKPSSQSNGLGLGPKVIAFRAELDALRMKEDNPDLPYHSLTDCAHMCGHDGHAVALLAALIIMYDLVEAIPDDRLIKFIFQPAEETQKGARLILDSGELNNVDEIYAIHNSSYQNFGSLYLYPGFCMAACTSIDILISVGQDSGLNPLRLACQVNAEIEHALENELKDINFKQIVFSLPVITASNDQHLLATQASLGGTLRYFDSKYKAILLGRLGLALDAVKALGPEVSVTLKTTDSSQQGVYNDPVLTTTITSILASYDVSPGVYPSFVSDDFAFYTEKLRGCYFSFDIGKGWGPLHSSHYNFNDDAIEPIANIWHEIAMARLCATQRLSTKADSK